MIKTNRKPSFPTGTLLPVGAAITGSYCCIDELEVYEAKTPEGLSSTAVLWRFLDAKAARSGYALQKKWWTRLAFKHQLELFPLGEYIYTCGLAEIPGIPLETLLQHQQGAPFPIDVSLDIIAHLIAAGRWGEELGLHSCLHPLLVWVDPKSGAALPMIGVEESRFDGLPQFYRTLLPFSHMEIDSEKTLCFMIGFLLYRMLSGVQVGLQEKHFKKIISDLAPVSRWNPKVDRALAKLTHLCLKALDSPEPVSLDQVSGMLEAWKSSRDELAEEKVTPEKSISVTQPAPRKRLPQEGLAGIAGMARLKELLNLEIIGPFQNPEKYLKYGLNIPNGILLFGPPGCGKTHIARKLAEELGFYYQEIVPSTIASSYIHRTTMHIHQAFRRAIREAPSLIFIDEIDALAPSRGDLLQQFKSEEVSELLVQLNNCAEKNILVIGASNEPLKMDPAILRPGRFDKLIYVGPPDEEARAALLRFYLEERPVTAGFDSEAAAKKLVHYSCSDIRLLVDEASRFALKEEAGSITELHFAKALKIIPPSIDPLLLMQYRRFQSRGQA